MTFLSHLEQSGIPFFRNCDIFEEFVGPPSKSQTSGIYLPCSLPFFVSQNSVICGIICVFSDHFGSNFDFLVKIETIAKSARTGSIRVEIDVLLHSVGPPHLPSAPISQQMRSIYNIDEKSCLVVLQIQI